RDGALRCALRRPRPRAAGGTNNRAALAFEGVALLHAARTSQRDVLRDVPTTPNTYSFPKGEGNSWRRAPCSGHRIAMRRVRSSSPLPARSGERIKVRGTSVCILTG